MTHTNHVNSDDVRELTVLWTKAQPAVAAFIGSAIPDFHEAEDMLQEVAVVVAEKFSDYDRERPFIGWAIGIAKHKIIDHGRRKKTQANILVDSEVLAHVADAYEEMDGQFERMKPALDLCIKALQGRSRHLFEMRYKSEFTPKQIANKLGQSTNAIYIQLHRVRDSLGKCIRKRLAMMGGSKDE